MILIHACCVDCTLNLIDSIGSDRPVTKSDLLIYFYNPNIHPESEWHARKKALKNTLGPKGYQLAFSNWRPKDYFNQVKLITPTQRLDKKHRCPLCYRLRLTQAFKYAQKHQLAGVTTTMLASTYMDQNAIKAIGHELSSKYQVDFFIPSDIICQDHHAGFYKQNYCGCIYSLKDKIEEKYFQ